jgi:NAD(P)-dependent dehydrogenase (short-subunit alcohol dehydrogenase family)
MSRRPERPVEGQRILITGAARGIGALAAKRLAAKGARVAVLGIEPELLEQTAADCGGTAHVCDVSDREQVDRAVAEAVEALGGGLDTVIANAGIAAQLPLVGGDPAVMEKTIGVNLLGTYYTIRAAGPYVSHPGGYVLLTASMAAAVHLPLLGAYNASKAGVEALGNTARIEFATTGARVGVAYYAELDTDMTSRGFGTEAGQEMAKRGGTLTGVAPVELAIDAIEAGVRHGSRRVVAPSWGAAVLPIRMIAQRVIDVAARRGLAKALEIARREDAPLTTPQEP